MVQALLWSKMNGLRLATLRPATECMFFNVIFSEFHLEANSDQFTDDEVEQRYEEFYEYAHTEFLKFGELVNFKQNSDWAEWHASILTKCNAVENVYQWACGRPTSLQDQGRDSDDEDFRDRDYDVAALASNLSQAFKYGIYSNEDIDEVPGSVIWR